MNNRRLATPARSVGSLAAVALSLALVAPPLGQAVGSELGRGGRLVVMIRGELAGEATVGAGILFGRDAENAYIVTSNHVVRRGPEAGRDMQVLLRHRPERWLAARVAEHFDPGPAGVDVAVLAIGQPDDHGLASCELPMDVMAQPGEAPLLERGTAVYPVGYPQAAPWGAPIVPDRVADVVSDTITFQSAFISSGHSGGALLTEGGDIVGLITSDQPPFGVAVRFERIVELLRRWGYPVHLHAADALHEAIIRGHEDEQRRLVEQCAVVNRRVAVDFDGRRWDDCTPLHFAALVDQPDAARLLLDHGADSELECLDMETPLDLAMRLGGARAAEVLLTHPRAKRPESDRLNYMLYQEIESRQNLAMMKVLIEHGADAGHPGQFASRAPLHQAASLSLGNYLSAQQRETIIATNVATARFLLESGAEVDQRDSYGQTALHLAAEHDIGSEEIARFLLRAGADPDAADDDGETPLHVASHHKTVMVVKALVEH